MRIFKSKWFDKFIRKNILSTESLRAAVAEIEMGKIDADLGGGVYNSVSQERVKVSVEVIVEQLKNLKA